MTLRTRFRPSDRFLVRHKDKAILVVEKRAGLLTHSTETGRGENLLALLRDFVGTSGRRGGVLPVHRLDRAVSGLLVFARTQEAQERLIDQFARHDVERTYIAVAQGLLTENAGTFESRLRTDHPSLKVYSDPEDGEERGRHAVTHWRVLERIRKTTLLEVRLETGIRNQIRVHFAEAGHALLGERKYGEERTRPQRRERTSHTDRLFLHAAVLGFVHPQTRKPVRWEAPLPDDLVRWLEHLRRRTSRSVLE